MDVRALAISGLVAGVVMALLSDLPIVSLGNCFFCLWLWGGGILGAWMYRRLHQEGHAAPLTGSQGLIVGLLSGFVGAIIGSVLAWLIGGVGLSAMVASQAESAEELLGGATTSFLTAGVESVVSLCFNLVLYPFFSAIGGAIGGVVFGRSPAAAMD